MIKIKFLLTSDIFSLPRLVLTEESNNREVQASEIETLRSKLVLVEERSQHFLSTLVSLRAAVDDEAERSANWAAQFKHDLANVQLALQVKNLSGTVDSKNSCVARSHLK